MLDEHLVEMKKKYARLTLDSISIEGVYLGERVNNLKRMGWLILRPSIMLQGVMD